MLPSLKNQTFSLADSVNHYGYILNWQIRKADAFDGLVHNKSIENKIIVNSGENWMIKLVAGFCSWDLLGLFAYWILVLVAGSTTTLSNRTTRSRFSWLHFLFFLFFWHNNINWPCKQDDHYWISSLALMGVSVMH